MYIIWVNVKMFQSYLKLLHIAWTLKSDCFLSDKINSCFDDWTFTIFILCLKYLKMSLIIFKVFRARTPPEAIELVARLLEYTPSSRISPLQACAHPFFNELREPNTRLPNGNELPPLFNFTEYGECRKDWLFYLILLE